MAIYRDITDGICCRQEFTADSFDEAGCKAEQFRQTKMIIPDDMELYKIQDKNGNTLKSYH